MKSFSRHALLSYLFVLFIQCLTLQRLVFAEDSRGLGMKTVGEIAGILRKSGYFVTLETSGGANVSSRISIDGKSLTDPKVLKEIGYNITTSGSFIAITEADLFKPNDNNILNKNIADINFEDVSVADALSQLKKQEGVLFEFYYFGKNSPGHKFSIHPKNMKLRSVLVEIAKAAGLSGWNATYSNGARDVILLSM